MNLFWHKLTFFCDEIDGLKALAQNESFHHSLLLIYNALFAYFVFYYAFKCNRNSIKNNKNQAKTIKNN